MGTWDVGPFDNDTAADWCGALDDAAPADRPQMLREALTAVVEQPGDYLDSHPACQAIAAAAVLAALQPGAAPVTTPYAPGFLRAGGRLPVPGDLAALAVRALDRIAGEDSEWRELWEDAPEPLAVLQQIRAALRPPGGQKENES